MSAYTAGGNRHNAALRHVCACGEVFPSPERLARHQGYGMCRALNESAPTIAESFDRYEEALYAHRLLKRAVGR